MKHSAFATLSRTVPLGIPALKHHSHTVMLVHRSMNASNSSTNDIASEKQNVGHQRNIVSCSPDGNLTELCKEGRLKEALDVLFLMDQSGTRSDSDKYAPLLQTCIKMKALAEGKKVHTHMIKSGFELDVFAGTKLVIMYVKCGCLLYARHVFDKMPEQNVMSGTALIAGYAQNGTIGDARYVFDKMPERNVVSWNALIAGYAHAENGEEALNLFRQMQLGGTRPTQFTFSSILGVDASLVEVEHGIQIHGQIIKSGFESDVTVGNALVNMYAKCGNTGSARHVFDKMPCRDVISWTAMIAGYSQNNRVDDAFQLFDKMVERNVVSWNAMIAGYTQNGYREEALQLFYEMQWKGSKPNQSTYVGVLKACASLASLKQGKQVHGHIIKTGLDSDVFVGSTLVDMYAKCGTLQDAREVFDKMSERNVVSWSAMITGYTQNGRMEDAEWLFDRMPERNVVSWNAMIAGKAQNNRVGDAMKFFSQMQSAEMEPNQFTFPSVLRACASADTLEQGKQVHGHIVKRGFESDVSVGNALVTVYAKHGNIDYACQVFDKMPEQDVISWTALIAGYAKNGRIEDARQLFQKMPERNVISWNTMITGYLQNGRTEDALQVFDKMPERNLVSWNAMITGYSCKEALALFFQMHQTGINPDQSTFTGVLSACAHLAALDQGKRIHGHIFKKDFESDTFVCNALITMYWKCGNVHNARQVLNEMPEPDMISWNAMIVGYAQHGSCKEALQLFEQMQQSGLKPNHVTFIGVLSACSHAGLVDEGWLYFQSMSQDHHIIPRAEHYACMVDLLGRAGYLDEAEEFIKNMSCEPDAVVWGALLGACKIHANIEVGKRVAERLFELEPQNAAAYVILSNIYAMAGHWDDVAKVRIMMKDRGIKKKPGCSWIEVKNKVHEFLVGDRSHLQTAKINAMLAGLDEHMKAAGYVADKNLMPHDVEPNNN